MMNVTSSGADANSRLIDLRVNGVSQMTVSANGMINVSTINANTYIGIPTSAHSTANTANVTAGAAYDKANTANSTADAAGIGQQTLYVPAIAMWPTTTNGAEAGAVAITTSVIEIKTFDFDGATEEFIQFAVQMPKSWDAGTLIAQFIGSQTGATTNFGVVWGIEAVCIADDELLSGVSWGTEVTTADTYGTTDDLFISAESTAITVGSTPASEQLVYFRITRVVGNGSDTMTTADARLHGVKIHYTVDASKDD
jgi:hypothetical protein